MLGCIYRDLHRTIRDNGNGPFGIAPRPPQHTPNRAPGSREVMEVDPFTFEGVCKRVDRGGLIPPRANLPRSNDWEGADSVDSLRVAIDLPPEWGKVRGPYQAHGKSTHLWRR